MKHSALMVCAGALLIGGAAGGYCGVRAMGGDAAPAVEASRDAAGAKAVDPSALEESAGLSPAEPLAWSELLEPGAAFVPSAKTRALAGQRVRLVGFMAEMELPIPGAFYLVPQPVECDEAGGGTADLMPTSVLVISESARGQVVPHVPGALDVTGVLEVGNLPGPDGRMSAFRLRLDRGAASTPAVPDGTPRPSNTRVGNTRPTISG
jgi:hypothetical protein